MLGGLALSVGLGFGCFSAFVGTGERGETDSASFCSGGADGTGSATGCLGTGVTTGVVRFWLCGWLVCWLCRGSWTSQRIANPTPMQSASAIGTTVWRFHRAVCGALLESSAASRSRTSDIGIREAASFTSMVSTSRDTSGVTALATLHKTGGGEKTCMLRTASPSMSAYGRLPASSSNKMIPMFEIIATANRTVHHRLARYGAEVATLS